VGFGDEHVLEARPLLELGTVGRGSLHGVSLQVDGQPVDISVPGQVQAPGHRAPAAEAVLVLHVKGLSGPVAGALVAVAPPVQG